MFLFPLSLCQSTDMAEHFSRVVADHVVDGLVSYAKCNIVIIDQGLWLYVIAAKAGDDMKYHMDIDSK